MIKGLLLISIAAFSSAIYAFETTGKGKIISTQGHVSPNCRTVAFKENDTNIVKAFRIQDIPTDDDISAVALSALMANRDASISYEPAVTSGCGTEPRILFITVY